MKKLLLLYWFVCLPVLLFATTIIIYITPDFVIMATDSKAVYTNAKNYRQTTATVSKIYKRGNVYFSLAGLVSNNNRSFNLAEIINGNLAHASDLVAAIEQIKAAVKEVLLAYLNNQKKNNPSLYKKNITGDKYITSIGIVTIKNNRPYTHLIGFTLADTGRLKIKTDEEVYDTNVDRDAVYYLGTSDEINRYINSIKRNNSEPVKFVEELMNMQIAKTPALVSAPIDILKLTPNQTTWIKKMKGTPVELK